MGVLEIVTMIIGALVGGSGSLLNRWIGMREQSQKFKHELALHKLNMQQHDADLENEARVAESQSYASMRAASMVHDIGTGIATQWVIDLLRLVRPALTVLLALLVWWIYVTTTEPSLREEVVRGVLFITTSAFTWWFGDSYRRSAGVGK